MQRRLTSICFSEMLRRHWIIFVFLLKIGINKQEESRVWCELFLRHCSFVKMSPKQQIRWGGKLMVKGSQLQPSQPRP